MVSNRTPYQQGEDSNSQQINYYIPILHVELFAGYVYSNFNICLHVDWPSIYYPKIDHVQPSILQKNCSNMIIFKVVFNF